MGALLNFFEGRFSESPHALKPEAVLQFERKEVTRQLATLFDEM